jgi:hypothetical protein
MLGQAEGINDAASLTLAGGVLRTFEGTAETLGAIGVTGSSVIEFFPSWPSTLTFASLDLGGRLSIWNYSGADDFLYVTSGTATGSLSEVAFYSDSGSTFLGYGGFESTRLVPVAVPEPATLGMAAVGIAALAARRVRTARCRARSRQADRPEHRRGQRAEPRLQAARYRIGTRQNRADRVQAKNRFLELYAEDRCGLPHPE